MRKNKIAIHVLQVLFLSVFVISCASDDEFDPDDQLAKELVAIDQYLEDNGIDAEIHESGIRYVIHDPGQGLTPRISDEITINYEGRFFDGAVFDSAQNITFPLANLIQGWQIGLPLISTGGSITLYLPSGYAYGTRGASGAIPGNTSLIFDIDLIAVN